MYKRLVAYKKEQKHTNIPQRCKEDPKLGYWVSNQRGVYRNKTLTEKRNYLLNFIGFEWGKLSKRKKAPWEEVYQRLVAYKKEHKHTNVPQLYKEDQKLGYWVNNQRIVYKKKRMTKERQYLFNFIGFEWKLRSL